MTADEPMNRRDELEAMLPFYLNGTLEGEDLRAVEAWLSEDAAARQALEEAELELRTVTTLNDAIHPPGDALARFSAALDADEASSGSPKPSLVTRLRRWIAASPSEFAWAVAAVMLAIIAVQALAPRSPDTGLTIAGAEDDTAAMPFALVSFKAQAPMADVLALLDKAGVTIIAGPAPGGVFKIAIPARSPAEYDRILALITEAGVTRSALVGRRPADAH